MRLSPLVVPLMAAVAVLVGVFYSTQAPTHDASELLRSTLVRYTEEGRARIENYSRRVEARVNESLTRLFDELDKDHNGCIDRSEFSGRTINMIATVRNLELPELALPTMPTVEYSVSIARRIVGLQLLFLVVLFILEHVRIILFDPPFSIDVSPVKWDATPTHAPLSRALHYDTPNTWYETFKLALFTVTGVLFLRIALTVIFFTLGILCVNLSVLGGRSRSKNPTWFRVCTVGVKIFGYLALAGLGFYYIRVAGKRASLLDTKLLVGNHICMVEVVALYLLADVPSFVSRVENLKLPLFSGLAEASDAIVVDRDAASSRNKTLAAIKRRTNDPEATQLLIFPEGTCSNQRTLFQFKKGAFEPGVPVQLVCFHYPNRYFNPAWTGRACGGNDAWDLLLRMWSQFVNRLEVRFLPVYMPSEAERADPIAFAKHCQNVMASVVHAETSDATFADYVEAYKRFTKRIVVNADSNVTTPRGDASEKKQV